MAQTRTAVDDMLATARAREAAASGTDAALAAAKAEQDKKNADQKAAEQVQKDREAEAQRDRMYRARMEAYSASYPKNPREAWTLADNVGDDGTVLISSKSSQDLLQEGRYTRGQYAVNVKKNTDKNGDITYTFSTVEAGSDWSQPIPFRNRIGAAMDLLKSKGGNEAVLTWTDVKGAQFKIEYTEQMMKLALDRGLTVSFDAALEAQMKGNLSPEKLKEVMKTFQENNEAVLKIQEKERPQIEARAAELKAIEDKQGLVDLRKEVRQIQSASTQDLDTEVKAIRKTAQRIGELQVEIEANARIVEAEVKALDAEGKTADGKTYDVEEGGRKLYRAYGTMGYLTSQIDATLVNLNERQAALKSAIDAAETPELIEVAKLKAILDAALSGVTDAAAVEAATDAVLKAEKLVKPDDAKRFTELKGEYTANGKLIGEAVKKAGTLKTLKGTIEGSLNDVAAKQSQSTPAPGLSI